jgi:glycosyltransferase involved in cell wall biosynthesis
VTEVNEAVSIAIPCYEMHGYGASFLDWGLARIETQTYPHIQVIVADHSVDDEVEKVSNAWVDRLDIKYIRNEYRRGSSSANANAALTHSDGSLIKVLCQDDYLFDAQAIERTVGAFADASAAWLISSYMEVTDRSTPGRCHDPFLNRDIAIKNTLGTHSALTLRAGAKSELFDENLIWLMDCEYYRRLYDRFGPPILLNEPTVIQFLWRGQVTHTHAASRRLRKRERRYVKHRHPVPLTELPRKVRSRHRQSGVQ